MAGFVKSPRRAARNWATLVLTLVLMLALPLWDEARAQDEARVALVIGNSAYSEVPALPNAGNDGRAMAEQLRALGFEVFEGIDLNRAEMENLVRAFGRGLTGADVGLFFYAGHGIQVEDENYLIPIDAVLESEADLIFEALRMSDVLSVLNRQVETSLIFLDACRDNPFAEVLQASMGASRSTSVGRGLARVDSGLGSFVAYATERYAIAADGEGDHSPFTEALLEHIDTPGLEVRGLLTKVREQVVQVTDGTQVPWDNSSLTGEFYFAGREATDARSVLAQAEARLRAEASEVDDPTTDQQNANSSPARPLKVAWAGSPMRGKQRQTARRLSWHSGTPSRTPPTQRCSRNT